MPPSLFKSKPIHQRQPEIQHEMGQREIIHGLAHLRVIIAGLGRGIEGDPRTEAQPGLERPASGNRL